MQPAESDLMARRAWLVEYEKPLEALIGEAVDKASEAAPEKLDEFFAEFFSSKPVFLPWSATVAGKPMLLARHAYSKEDKPIHLVIGGKGQPPGPFAHQPGQLFLLHNFPQEENIKHSELAAWLLQHLAQRVPIGSTVIFNSFAGSALWHVLVHKRSDLAALKIACHIVAPAPVGLEGTDVREVLQFIMSSPWLQCTITIHDGFKLQGMECRKPLEAILAIHAKRVSSAEFFAMSSSEARRHRILYVGAEDEIEQIAALTASNQRPDGAVFALHGSTQKKAALLLHEQSLEGVL